MAILIYTLLPYFYHLQYFSLFVPRTFPFPFPRLCQRDWFSWGIQPVIFQLVLKNSSGYPRVRLQNRVTCIRQSTGTNSALGTEHPTWTQSCSAGPSADSSNLSLFPTCCGIHSVEFQQEKDGQRALRLQLDISERLHTEPGIFTHTLTHITCFDSFTRGLSGIKSIFYSQGFLWAPSATCWQMETAAELCHSRASLLFH